MTKVANVHVEELVTSKDSVFPAEAPLSQGSEDGESTFAHEEKCKSRTKVVSSYLALSLLCIVCLFLVTLPGSPISLTYHRFHVNAAKLDMTENRYFSVATNLKEAQQEEATSLDSVAWMRKIPDARSITDLNLPGTHDSTARFGGSSYVCQSLSLEDQLELGIRFFDIRLVLSNGKLNCQHGRVFQKQDFEQVLTTMEEFLEANPSEAVFLKIQQEHTRYSSVDFGNSISSSLALRSRIFSAPNAINAESVPSLVDIRGKMIIIPRFFDLSSINTIPYEAMTAQDDFKVDLTKKQAAIISFYESTQEQKRARNHNEAQDAHLDKRHRHSNPEELSRIAAAKALHIKWYINHFSLHNNVVNPRDAAYNLNPVIAKLINPISALATGNTTASDAQIEAIKREPFGVMMMDFIGPDSVRLIVDSNF